MQKLDSSNLVDWYQLNYRKLPWRQYKDPYAIWISETMLQQTTSVGVLPFYEKFMARFPNLNALAKSELEDVYSYWAGLGYYSRAKNLHRCANEIIKLNEFPKSWSDLILLPGIGPYTSRAISSLAYEEPVGVVDGNVIRIFSRFYGLKWKWWVSKEKNRYQKIADEWAQSQQPSLINQALMELGATLCRPRSPRCQMCPLITNCLAFKQNKQQNYPLKKPKREPESWMLKIDIIRNKNKVAFIKDADIPFLKGKLIPPCTATQVKLMPKKYDYIHSITHHKIYVSCRTMQFEPKNKIYKDKFIWIDEDQISRINPSSLIQKALKFKLQDVLKRRES